MHRDTIPLHVTVTRIRTTVVIAVTILTTAHTGRGPTVMDLGITAAIVGCIPHTAELTETTAVIILPIETVITETVTWDAIDAAITIGAEGHL